MSRTACRGFFASALCRLTAAFYLFVGSAPGLIPAGGLADAQAASNSTQSSPTRPANKRVSRSAATAKSHRSSSSGGSSRKAATKKSSSRKRNAKAAPAQKQLHPTPERYAEIQSALAQAGYLQGPANGVWDQASVDALRRFQEDQGLDPTGRIDSLSLIKLNLGPKYDNQPNAVSSFK